MTFSTLDDLAELRFHWPEPLLIDLISESYGSTPDAKDRLAAARIHARFLRALVDAEIRPAAALRVELIACCAARHIDPGAMERADQAAFLEMVRIVRTRFRNSPKMCLHFMQRLHVALARLPKNEPSPKTRNLRPAWARSKSKAPSNMSGGLVTAA